MLAMHVRIVGVIVGAIGLAQVSFFGLNTCALAAPPAATDATPIRQALRLDSGERILPDGRKPATSSKQLVTSQLRLADEDEHPLAPAVRYAREGLSEFQSNVDDYEVMLIKRELIRGKMMPTQYLACKIREQPFSVYIRFLSPSDVAGREVIYVEGQNNNQMHAHATGMAKRVFGTVTLAPTSNIAMRTSRYPLTHIGVSSMVERLLEVAEKDLQHGECEVKHHDNVQLGSHNCLVLEVIHPVNRPHFAFHKVRLYIDKELNIPIRLESYGFPSTPGGKEPLIEEYTYTKFNFNVGLSEIDFSTRNPRYDFPN